MTPTQKPEHRTAADALSIFRSAPAADATTRRVEPTLAQRLSGGESFALSFSGQGFPWLETLTTCVSAGVDARVRTLLAEAEQRLAPVADRLAGQRPDGFDPIAWAESAGAAAAAAANADPVADPDSADGAAAAAGPVTLPGLPDLDTPAVSVPGIVAAQIAVIDLLDLQGIKAADAAAAIGHSQGILGAAAAQNPERAGDVMALAEIIGVAVARQGRVTGMTAIDENTPSQGTNVAGTSYPMMVVNGARADQVEPLLAGDAVIGLRNGRNMVVVVGTPADLRATETNLERAAKKDAAELDAKLRGGSPFTPTCSPLTVGAAFHHPDMAAAVDETVEMAAAIGIEEDFARPLAEHVLTDRVDWPAQVAAVTDGTEASAKWILEMGPGLGVAALTRQLLEGTGVGVITVAVDQGQAELFEPGSAPAAPATWDVFAPRLVTRDGRARVETKFTDATGRSPIILGGMTPTTVDPAIVAAAANAGFWAELAGGGQVTPEIFNENVSRLHELLDEGASAQFNTMFLDPYLWGMHIGNRRLVQRAVAAGRPIDGVTISAGIPETDEAVSLVRELRAGGIPHVSFKPGTIKQIKQVLAIADALAEDAELADVPVTIQVEGGRAGGHHSWEELDDLLVGTYAAIRARDNVVLAVGGGIGRPEQAADYLLGRWSERLGYPAMPVDAIIIGTAAMAAKESTASSGVKKMLVETAGTDAWVPAGGAAEGMASGRSQLGADIHEIDNAAARAGRLLDEVANDVDAVAARRDEIIEAINGTAKPYFGDVEEMTYREVLDRYVELSAPEGEFLDPSWAARFSLILDRFEARLADTDAGEFDSVRTESGAATTPAAAAEMAEAYDLDQRLHPADVTHFLTEACRTPGKPVGFVPVIDAEVRRWWRSDSLWQAHDERFDADGVCIIPGTAAVAGITKADVPVAEILGSFEEAAATELAERAEEAKDGDDAAVGTQGSIARVLSAPVIRWAGRQQANPAQQLGKPSEWELADDAASATHAGTGARLSAASADADTVTLTVPLAGSGGDNELTLNFDASGPAGTVPVIPVDSAAESMRALTAIAAGGTLPEVTDGVAAWESTWTTAAAADHGAVTGAGARTAPDALVGHAWPAIFSCVANATTDEGVPVVEGMLALVHLEHHIRLVTAADADNAAEAGPALLADGTRLAITAHCDEVADTEMGRVVLVRAEIRDAGAEAGEDGEGNLIATLSERFAIRGRNGDQAARVNTVPLPTVTDGPRSHRATVTVTAPRTLVPFATVSGDRNPIHVDDRAAMLAGLPGVIVHGMWLSAAAEHAAIAGSPAGLGDRVTEFTATMLSPVLPGQDVTFTVERRGTDSRPGNGEVREVMATVDGEPVLQATAVIAAPTTFYAFPGQGIQSKGMGLEARANSAAARAVWDEADRVTRENLGFSVLAIVRDNPTEVTVAGRRFHHPEGVLNLTQFTQVSMATLGLAQAAELREAEVLDEEAYFAGHSVGEYNALAAFAGVLDAAAVLEVVYHRGLTMHSLVPRDENGRSNYGLAALRPDKCGVAESDVEEFVAGIAKESGEFLEVVNHNLAGKQYAVAGTVAGLKALQAAANEAAPDGKAYVRIPGIDVPFHSAVLRDGVDEFRGHLDRLLPDEVDADVLVGRYIPNLTATQFALTEEFVREMAEVAESKVLDDILADFDAAVKNPSRLARTLLVELLAWQFCSPVRWIETQDLVMGELGVSRVIEVGVGTAPTIANLAARTAALPRHADRDITVWNVERDRDLVFARDEQRPEVEESDASAEAPAPAESADPAAEASAEAAPAPAAAPVATSAERPADITVTPGDAVEVLIALWTKVRPDQMGGADSIETLVDGVSSRRNQLLLDLGAEFGLGAIDGAADADLPSLKDKVSGMVRGWTPWGPVLSEALADGLRRVTGPAGARANHVADRVRDTWQLGDGWVEAVIAEVVLGSRDGASLRGGDLGHLAATPPASSSELDQLIDSAVQAVGAARGVTVTMPASGGGAGGVVDSAALGAFAEQVTGSGGVLAVAARTILEELGHELTGAVDFDAEDADDKLVDLVTAELGSDWPKLVTPSFDADRAVLIDDRWATSRDDLARMWAASDEDLEAATPKNISASAVKQANFWAGRADAAGRKALAKAYRGLADTATNPGDGDYAADVAVVTGGSPGSIAAAVIGGLLAGGATVVATTSSLNNNRLGFYKELYRTNAIDGAKLWVVPANLTSYQDLDAVVDWVGNEQTATVGAGSVVVKPALTPTLLFPFAAPRVAGSLADSGPASEMQMRLLLWSVERLIAGLSTIGADTDVAHRLHAVLPGSPNRGRFGGDGAYGESKAALDAVVTRWNVEKVWGDRTSLVHAHIGWVRGTGLMGGNDPLVEAVEAKGVRTYATEEMAEMLLEQASAEARAKAAETPITVDLTGGLGDVDLNMSKLAEEAMAAQQAADEADDAPVPHVLRGLPGLRKPLDRTAPDFSGVSIDPEDMIVIVGAGELGPYGSSRTRFEAELGELSAAGVVELAWTMGLISYDGGWLDADGEPIDEEDIVERYRDEVTARVGVRRYGDDGDLVDNTMTELTTIYLDRDLSFPARDKEEALTYVETDPENTTARPDEETGEWIVTRRAGTAVQVPRRMAMSRYVGGQIPEGFDPAVYGLPADMIENLDRVSLWNIVCTVDAFLSSGFTPAELLGAVHPGLVSSTQGTGIGAMESLRSLFIDGILGLPRANDVLQEALPNVIAAHVMQSYVGGYGQMVHPVAACATAAVSVEEGIDKIQLGKADFVVAGGYDDLSVEGITGFGDMAATADSRVMDAKGIDRRFFSRPNDRRRGGFVESQGGGTVLLARGSVARDLGLPVLGVVAYADSFADGAHTSIPAPGLGALGAGRGGEKSRLFRALKAHGVSADEVAVLSKHDTSTNANDPNESELHERLADALGRDESNPMFVVSQKSLTGHAKGGAAAFQMIGLTQVLRSGVLPANRSLDCVDPVLSKHGRLVWPTKPIEMGEALPLKAGFVTSLGFGHVSALVAIVHPEVFHAAVAKQDGEKAAAEWRERAEAREAEGARRIEDAIYGGEGLYERPEGRRLGDGGEYRDTDVLEKAVILNPEARLVDGVLSDKPGN